MGFPPDLPDEIENDCNFNITNESIINYGQNTSEDSDNDDNNPYDGYQPIPFGDNGSFEDINNVDNYMDENQGSELEINQHEQIQTITNADTEIEKEVWDKPRPKELEIELDQTKTQEILAAMATITLPTSAIPEWARDISEEKWKENLLEKIRQRKNLNDS